MMRKMRKFIGIILVAIMLSGLQSCYNTSIKKPDNLISKDKFVKMMVAMYLIQGMNSGTIHKDILKKINHTDLYYSVLKKYSVPDTVFIRSLVYYSSFPKEYEKMHVEIMNNLKETEEKLKPKDKLQVEPE